MRFLAAFALCLAALPAFAQDSADPTLPDKGVRELNLAGQLGLRPRDTYDINLRYARFENPRIQYGAEASLVRGGGRRQNTYGFFANVHTAKTVRELAFAGIYLGTISGGGTASTSVIGFQAGLKYFLNSGVAITPQFTVREPTKSRVPETVKFEVGISLFLR